MQNLSAKQQEKRYYLGHDSPRPPTPHSSCRPPLILECKSPLHPHGNVIIYLGHEPPHTPHPHHSTLLLPSTLFSQMLLIQVNSYMNECKIPLHPHGTFLSWPWFPPSPPPHPTLLLPSTTTSYLTECKKPFASTWNAIILA